MTFGFAGLMMVFIAAALALRKPPNEASAGDIVVVGDSLGLGVGPAMRRRGMNPRIEAVSGTQARWWAEGTRWEKALEGAQTAVVSLGSNDIASNRPPWTTLQNLETRAKMLGVRVIWLVPNTPLWANQAVIIPGETLYLAGAEGSKDGVHLTIRGYDKAAELVHQRLS